MISGRLVTLWGPDVVFDTGSCHPARRADAAVRANGPRAWWRLQREHKPTSGPRGPSGPRFGRYTAEWLPA